jgi:alkylated DNA repair protein alkB homolog 1
VRDSLFLLLSNIVLRAFVDWTRRAYVQDEHSAFPADLAALCSRVAGLVRESSPASELDLELDAEAGIINYYPLGTCMGGHLDDAEHELMRPIVSFSLGLSGLFLLGGSGKNSEPRALLLRAGDAVVMAGESRRCYHGVPAVLSLEQERLLSPSVPSTLLAPSSAPSAQQQQVLSYLRGSRVNMNARQVRRKDGSAWVDKSGTGYVDA